MLPPRPLVTLRSLTLMANSGQILDNAPEIPNVKRTLSPSYFQNPPSYLELSPWRFQPSVLLRIKLFVHSLINNMPD